MVRGMRLRLSLFRVILIEGFPRGELARDVTRKCHEHVLKVVARSEVDDRSAASLVGRRRTISFKHLM